MSHYITRFDEHLILYITHQHPVPFSSLAGNEVVQGLQSSIKQPIDILESSFFLLFLIVITEIPSLLLFRIKTSPQGFALSLWSILGMELLSNHCFPFL